MKQKKVFAFDRMNFILLAVGMAVLLSRRHGRIAMLPLLLAGIVVGIFLSAVTAAILTIMEEHKLQQYLFWTIGGLDYRTFDHVWLGALPITFGTVCLLLLFGARQADDLFCHETAFLFKKGAA